MLNYRKQKISAAKCQLEDNKICDNCCQCYICDLDPDKICNNCAMCLKIPDYSGVIIDDILILEETRLNPKKASRKKA